MEREGPDASDVPVFSVGEVATRLGVAPATLRSWGRRYGLVPAARSAGGHRRYSAAEVERLRRVQQWVDAGVAPAQAAARVLADAAGSESPAVAGVGAEVGARRSAPVTTGTRDGAAARGTGGPGGAVLAVPGGGPRARGLARAASRLDGRAVVGILGDLLITAGTVVTWEEVVRPVLVAVGERWARTGGGIDVEHVLTEATVEALRAHRTMQAAAGGPTGAPVVLACASDDTHVLPLHVVAAALAERQVTTQVLGARVPGEVVVAVGRRIGCRGVLVGRQLHTDATARDLTVLAGLRSRPTVAAGGPGWDGCQVPAGVRRPTSLREAVDLFAPLA